MSKRTYGVTIPMAGHLYIEVDAESEAEAIEKAGEEVSLDNLSEWSELARFNQGNICYCPQPWETTVEDLGEATEF